jgi:hypothetical protein
MDHQDKLVLDLDTAVSFLQWLRPGPWMIVAIIPDGNPEAATLTDPRAFIIEQNNDRHKNLYFTPNPLRPSAPKNKKAAKTDVAAIVFIPADLDPNPGETPEAAKRRYLDQIDKGVVPRPTAAIISGNGLQGLWQLETPIILGEPALVDGELKFAPEDQAKIDDVEARSKALMERLGAKPGTQNVDRILRLPGTINYPNAKKKREGRVECMSELLWSDGPSYPLMPSHCQR